LKVATGILSKVVGTTATVMIATPAFKLASLGAMAAQIVMEEIKADKRAKQFAALRVNLTARVEEADTMWAERDRLALRAERLSTTADATERAIGCLPKRHRSTTLRFAAIGGGIGALTPVVWSKRVAPLVIVAILLAQAVRRVNRLACAAKDNTAAQLATTTAAAEDAAEEASRIQADIDRLKAQGTGLRESLSPP